MAGPGAPKTGGREKGTPNKVTKQLKELILGALDGVGGQAYLERQAEENPRPVSYAAWQGIADDAFGRCRKSAARYLLRWLT